MLSLICTCLIAILPQIGQSDEKTDKPLQNTIKWATASEENNFGFNVYRADSEDGPFTKLNDKPIAGSGTTDEPMKYSYVDENIEPNKAYFYYVESISLDGVRERFTPVLKAKPKSPDSGQ